MEELQPPTVEYTAYMALGLERKDLVDGIKLALAAGATPEMIAARLAKNSAKPALVQLALLAARYIQLKKD